MTTKTNRPSKMLEALEIIQNAGDENGWMSEDEYQKTQSKLRQLGIGVITSVGANHEDQLPATDEHGRVFVEVSIHPLVQQFADESGKPVDGDWFNPCTSDLDRYPDSMFRKEWSVSSWVQDPDDDYDFDDEGEYDGDLDAVHDEVFPDYDTAIARAEELAIQCRVEIDHRY